MPRSTPYRSRPALRISTSSQDTSYTNDEMDAGGEVWTARGAEGEQELLDPGSYMDDASPPSSSAFSFSPSSSGAHNQGAPAVPHRGVSFADNGSTMNIDARGGGGSVTVGVTGQKNKRAVQVVGWGDNNPVHRKAPHIEGRGYDEETDGNDDDHDKENENRNDGSRRRSGEGGYTGATPTTAAMEILQGAQRQGLGRGQGKSFSPYPRSALKRIRDALGG